LLLALLLALALPAAGVAARAPTPAERVAITRALPAGQTSVPARCLYLETQVSGSYAKVTPTYLVDPAGGSSDPCLRYAADGFYLLKRSGAKWAVVYTGSELPPCARHFPRDLTSCL
jgi:hypothetical protein